MKKSKIINELKLAGYSTKDVTVSTSGRSETAYKLTIRSEKVNLLIVNSIAKNSQNISYCEFSGEILSGGNTFCRVELADNVRAEWGKTWNWLLGSPEVVSEMNAQFSEENCYRIGSFLFSKNNSMVDIFQIGEDGSGTRCFSVYPTELAKIGDKLYQIEQFRVSI